MRCTTCIHWAGIVRRTLNVSTGQTWGLIPYQYFANWRHPGQYPIHIIVILIGCPLLKNWCIRHCSTHCITCTLSNTYRDALFKRAASKVIHVWLVVCRGLAVVSCWLYTRPYQNSKNLLLAPVISELSAFCWYRIAVIKSLEIWHIQKSNVVPDSQASDNKASDRVHQYYYFNKLKKNSMNN